MKLSDLQVDEGQSQLADISGQEVLLCRSGGTLYAIGSRCPHQNASLLEGKLRGRTIICPLHGARFDMSTGRALGSKYPPIPVYELHADGQDGELSIAPAASSAEPAN